MLIQVQHQRERDGLDDEAEFPDIDLIDRENNKNSLAIEESKDVQVKQEPEILLNKNDTTEKPVEVVKSSENVASSDKQESISQDFEMKDVENSDAVIKIEDSVSIAESTDLIEADSHEKDLKIDPRTYCKLGHFHLLLEDYAKGNTWQFSFCIQFYQFRFF